MQHNYKTVALHSFLNKSLIIKKDSVVHLHCAGCLPAEIAESDAPRSSLTATLAAAVLLIYQRDKQAVSVANKVWRLSSKV